MEVKDREDKDIRQPDLKSMNMEELRNWVTGAGQPAFRAKQIYQWFHVKLADGTEEMTNLPKSLREKMGCPYQPRNLPCLRTLPTCLYISIRTPYISG